MWRSVAIRLCAALILFSAATTHAGASVLSDPAQNRFDLAVADAKASMLLDPNVALSKARQAERDAARIVDSNAQRTAIATAEWLQGEANNRMGQISRAAPLISRALATARSATPSSKLEGDILLSSGSVHQSRAEVAAALSDYQAAHAIFQRIGDVRSRAIALICLAGLYNEANDHVAALKYLGQALDLYQADPGLAVSIYNSRGRALKDLGRYAEAEAQFTRALRLARQMGSLTLEGQVLRNIARTQLMATSLADADRTIAEGYAVARRRPRNNAAEQSLYLSIAAQSALQHGRPREAESLIARSFEGVDARSTTLSFREAHQTAYETYRVLGRPDLALTHLAALKRLDDQATRLATTTNTVLMAARFDFANQELRIAHLKADELSRNVARAREQAKIERLFFLAASGATACVIAVLAFALFTIRRSRDRVRAANTDLGLTNAALAKALAAKTEFLATTSHEIRTPLNGILGMTQVMLADNGLAADVRERLGVVQGAGLTMRALVDDILDVAKMETGNLTIEHVPFDLKATVAEAARLWEDQARTKGIVFSSDLADCPERIEGDSARVRQIVFNLLSNALKFSPGGSVALTIRTDEEERTFRIVVADTGVGIPADKVDEIFESFRQADPGTTRQFGGTGLGLAICRNLARAMGGAITVESVLGQGSTFTVTLPLVRAEALSACQLAAITGEPGLLVVDRNPITRSMFKAMLTPHAGTVVFAGSIDEVVDCLREGAIDRVLIDDVTVREEGDVVATLRTIAHEASRTDAVTTLLWRDDETLGRDALLSTGIDRIVTKPVVAKALIAAIFESDSEQSSGATLVSHAA